MGAVITRFSVYYRYLNTFRIYPHKISFYCFKKKFSCFKHKPQDLCLEKQDFGNDFNNQYKTLQISMKQTLGRL